MNTINANAAWKLSQCKINNNDVDFFVKLVHVDRYKDGQDAQVRSRSQKRSKSVSVNRNRQTPNRKWEKSFDGGSVNILHSISVWNERKKADQTAYKTNKPIDVYKYRSVYSHSQHIALYNDSKRQTSIKHQRNYTEKVSHPDHYRHSEKLELPTNKSFQLQSNFTRLVLKTEPNQFSRLVDTPYVSKSNKKQTIKELVEYRKEKVLRKKDYQMKKFKTTLNNAKFSNFYLETQTK